MTPILTGIARLGRRPDGGKKPGQAGGQRETAGRRVGESSAVLLHVLLGGHGASAPSGHKRSGAPGGPPGRGPADAGLYRPHAPPDSPPRGPGLVSPRSHVRTHVSSVAPPSGLRGERFRRACAETRHAACGPVVRPARGQPRRRAGPPLPGRSKVLLASSNDTREAHIQRERYPRRTAPSPPMLSPDGSRAVGHPPARPGTSLRWVPAAMASALFARTTCRHGRARDRGGTGRRRAGDAW